MSDRYGPASSSSSHGGGGGRDGRGQGQPYAPPPNSVHRGTVTRLEPYGCFVQLTSFRARGLVHKSQLASYRVENVEDAVAVDDSVYVKVTEVTKQPHEDGSGRVRHKVSLSMKYADQDDGTDLDPAGEKAAEDLARRGGGGGDGGGGHQDGMMGANGGVASDLERSLGSRIGMATAIDPMAAMRSQRGGRVVLRGAAGSNGAGAATTTYNGYSLVDDDEGEPEVKVAPTSASVAAPVAETRPMGRGRGTTLPAWMTQNDGPTGATERDGASDNGRRARSRSRSHDSRSASSSSSSYDKRKRRSKKDKRRRSKSSRDRKHRKHDRERRRRRRSRSRSRSNSRSRSRDRRQKKDRKRDRGRSRRSRSRSNSNSNSNSDRSRGDREEFGSLEEARALIARLEGGKATRGQS